MHNVCMSGSRAANQLNRSEQRTSKRLFVCFVAAVCALAFGLHGELTLGAGEASGAQTATVSKDVVREKKFSAIGAPPARRRHADLV